MPAETQRRQEQQESNQELVQEAERILTEIPQTLNKIEERIDKIIANDYYTRFVVFLEYLRLTRIRQNIEDRLKTTLLLPSGRSSLSQEEITQFRKISASSKKIIDALFEVDDNDDEQREQVSQLSRLNAKITGVVAFFKYLDQLMSTDLIKSSISHSQLPIGKVNSITLEYGIVPMIQLFSLLRSIKPDSLPPIFTNLLDVLHQIDGEQSNGNRTVDSLLDPLIIRHPPNNDYLSTQASSPTDTTDTGQQTFEVTTLNYLINLMVAQHYGYISDIQQQSADNSISFKKKYARRYPDLLTDLKGMNAIEFFKKYVLSETSLPKRCKGQSPDDIKSLLEGEIIDIDKRDIPKKLLLYN